MGDRLLLTSLSLVGPCKHQWSFFARPYQQYVRCRIQVSVCEPLGSVLWRPAQFQQQSLEYDIRPSLFTYPLISPKQRWQVFLSLELVHLRHVRRLNFVCNLILSRWRLQTSTGYKGLMVIVVIFTLRIVQRLDSAWRLEIVKRFRKGLTNFSRNKTKR